MAGKIVAVFAALLFPASCVGGHEPFTLHPHRQAQPAWVLSHPQRDETWSIIWRRRKIQEVLWSANGNLKKVIHCESASARDGFRRARLVQCMARLRLSRLSEKMSLALRAGFFFAAPPLTVLGEPKTWLVRISRREFWPEFSAVMFLPQRAGDEVATPMSHA
jgi:hypothetical protein